MSGIELLLTVFAGCLVANLLTYAIRKKLGEK